jgi:hypothetical protein
MSAISTTYSFKDSSGALTNPVLLGSPIVFAGEIGIGEFIISMTTDRTSHDTSADSTVMPSYIAGDSGSIAIQVQQTSIIHQQLLDLYNILKSAADSGDVSNWAATTISLRNVVTGSQHLLQGVSFMKIPDKPYQAQGQRITWTLPACNVVNI